MMKRQFKIVYLMLFLAITLVLSMNLVIADPNWATVTQESVTRASNDSAGNNSAYAGNLTELSISGYSITQSWQGYFGNVSGTIELGDSSDNVMYNWSIASPEGEIYAAKNATVSWDVIQCFNFTATGNYTDDGFRNGSTNLYGTNMTILENEFGIDWNDVDGVNETFTLTGAGTHNEFYVNTINFTIGECQSTRLFSNADVGEDDKFEEVLLYDPDGRTVIFATLLNEDELGFDDKTHDFEMIVLEDGHDSDAQTTPYYFWVELE